MTRSKQSLILIAVLVVTTVCAYLPSLHAGFTNWDDPQLVLENPLIRNLSGPNVAAFFSRSFGGFGGYTPLVFVSYALEYRFFGFDSRAFHATNLALHLLNVLLVYAVVLTLSGSPFAGFFTSLLFAVHPLHVEAVSWVQGRKDLLFAAFFLAGLLCYARFLQGRRRKLMYALSLAFFVLSLFTKVAAVSFPLALLALEYFVGRRLSRASAARAAPFIVLAVVMIMVAVATGGSPGRETAAAPAGLAFLKNLGLFFYSFVFYLSKTALPVRLSARYANDAVTAAPALALNLIVFAGLLGLLALAYRRRREATLFGLSFFVLSLLPTLPFHFFGQPYADRYMYLPLLGVLFAVVSLADGGPVKAGPGASRPRRVALAALSAWALLLGILSFARAGVWHDSLGLWTDVLAKNPRSATAYLNRSEVLAKGNRLDEAMADLEMAEKYAPSDPNIPNNRGIVYTKRGQWEAALAEFSRALALNPEYYDAYLNRGALWGRTGQYENAVRDLTKALTLRNSYQAHYYRGLAYRRLNRADLAAEDFRAAYELEPTAQAREQLEALEKSGGPVR